MNSIQVINARKGMRLNNCPTTDAVNHIIESLAYMYTIKGQNKPKAADMITAATEIRNRLLEDYSTITLEELRLAMREFAYSGKESYGINPASVMQMVREYINTDAFKIAIRNEASSNVPRIAADNRKDEEIAKMVLRRDYDDLYNTGRWYEPRFVTLRGGVCYDYLVQMGQITPDFYKQFLGLKRTPDCWIRSIEGNADATTLAKYHAVNNYIVHKVNARKAKEMHSEDLPL